jgi:spore coat polysaccharide biosynthesis predicted glycosyltransferase SpsG
MYLKSILPTDLDYNIVIDIEDDNKLIAESKCVISAPSTLAFKPIQLGIPTMLINNSGQIGSFYDYGGLFDVSKPQLDYLLTDGDNTNWIERSIEGGVDFNSTNSVVSKLKEMI